VQQVSYVFDGKLWLANVDGTGAQAVGNALEQYQSRESNDFIGWSADGARLTYMNVHPGGFALVDAIDLARRDYELPCPLNEPTEALLSACRVDEGRFALSRDGTRVAYAIVEGSHDQSVKERTSTLVVFDLATGVARKLDSTKTTNSLSSCDAGAEEGFNHAGGWSSDGSRLIVTRDQVGPSVDYQCQNASLSVDVEGGELQELDLPAALRGNSPSWSPDGATILFDQSHDIYVGHSDGSDVRLLTTGGVSTDASWTRDGKIAFIRWIGEGRLPSGLCGGPADPTDGCADRRGNLWIMDADGRNASQLQPTVPALTAAGCIACPYPTYDVGDGAVVSTTSVLETPPYRWYGQILSMFWQPPTTGLP
jgi:Tol biopolymer transport system component